ncbi:hypothetical protein AHAS_Ahas07G0036700 [Arachis hypogaea]
MNIIKSQFRNLIRHEFLNDYLLIYIKNKIFNCINNKKVLQSFLNIKFKRKKL